MSNYKSTSDNDYPTNTRPTHVSRQSSGAWIIGGIAALLLILAIGWLATGNAPAPVNAPATQSTTETPAVTPSAPADPAAPSATPSAPADPAAPLTPPSNSGSTTTQ